MPSLGSEIGEIHLPERWAVLEQALRAIHAEDRTAEAGSKDEADRATDPQTVRVSRNRSSRDSEDVRSHNPSVRPAASAGTAGSEQHPRGGTR